MEPQEIYEIIIKQIYKHFDKCLRQSHANKLGACEYCYKLLPNIMNSLGTSPVFIVDSDEYLKTWAVSSTITGDLVDIPDETYKDFWDNVGSIQTYLDMCKALEQTSNKGLPFTQFVIIPETPIELPKEAETEWEIGYVWHEASPELWLCYTVTVTKTGVFNHYTKLEQLTSSSYRTIEYLLNKTTYIELAEFNAKVNIGYYNKNLPRNAKAKPVHIVYIGTKKDFIHKHPQYENKILREPKLAHLVRGHWRKLHDGQKHGKDRHGYPIFNGYTWVIPHKRGKGDLPETTIYVTQ